MRVAVTGAGGYIGGRLIKWLCREGEAEHVLGIDIVRPKEPPSRMTFVEQSVTEPMEDLFREHEIDTAVHFAYILNPIHDEAKMHTINVGGTRNFFSACAASNVKTILLASSATAYGFHPDNSVPLPEEAPLRPSKGFVYAEDKFVQERLCHDHEKNHPEVCLIIVRPVIVVGPNMDNVLTRFFLGSPLVGFRNEDPLIQFVHEDDSVALIGLLLKGRHAGTYNIGADGTMRYSEIAERTGAKVLSLRPRVLRFINSLLWILRMKQFSGAPSSVADIVRYPWVVSNEKVKKATGYSFRYDTRTAFDALVRSKAAGGSGKRSA